ncbi:MAG TPA: hypothetical protein GXZ90_01455 [Clostridiales bacterium]|nr:hypothetical protein [Clostridiales bacterium]
MWQKTNWITRDYYLEYNDFVDNLFNDLQKKLGEGCSISISKVLKNNSVELDVFVILLADKNIRPNIYILPYYQAYLAGTDLDEIVNRIICFAKDDKVNLYNESLDYNQCKDRIIIKLVNYEKNKKLLMDLPHIKFLDMAIIFHCLANENDKSISTIRIDEKMLSDWGINIQELYIRALNNSQRLLPAKSSQLYDVIRKIFENDLDINDKEFINIFCSKTNKMYVLTNDKGINGAACLLYKDILMEFAEKTDSDLYILPSSIHEMIILPVEEGLNTRVNKKMLEELVTTVNNEQVAPEEVLSDNVYYYSRLNKSITM